MAPIQTRLTYEDLREMPDDGRRYELLEGELAVSPAPKVSHQRVVLRLIELLIRAERAGYGTALTAPTDVVLSAETVVQPDLLFVSRERSDLVHEDNIAGPPDLVVEVLSAATRRRDLGPKMRVYAQYGVPSYWAADPDEPAVRVYALHEGAYGEPAFLRPGNTLSSPLFPTVSMPIDEVFAP